jgi:hypothetical protein
LGHASASLGVTYEALKEYDRAESLYRQRLHIAEQVGFITDVPSFRFVDASAAISNSIFFFGSISLLSATTSSA